MSIGEEDKETFQSHNGAIAAAREGHEVDIFVPFQSHNGAIAAQEVESYFRS